jgi:hypothetical protein
MNRWIFNIRKPVQRKGADYYLLITLLSFAASVTLTRLFLQLTGYPQLGGGELHIAHVLWGGLILFIASLMPLILSNRWVYRLSAILSGVGVGLFIDEVGKFITKTNNYFYPLAAPIIYALFLLVVLLYLRVRRPLSRDIRTELYRVFDDMEEVLDHDLNPAERADIEERLIYVHKQTKDPDLSRLAGELLDFLNSETLLLVPDRPGVYQKSLAIWQRYEQRWIDRGRMRVVLSGGLLSLGIVALINMIRALPFSFTSSSLQNMLFQLIMQGQVSSASGLNWFMARLALETMDGLILVIAGFLLLTRREAFGVGLGSLGLLLALSSINLLVFYFDQFSTIIAACFQFATLLGLGYYRRHYLPDKQTFARRLPDKPVD